MWLRNLQNDYVYILNITFSCLIIVLVHLEIKINSALLHKCPPSFGPRMLKRVTPSPPEAAQMLNADTDVASDDS